MARIILVRHGQDSDNAARVLNGHRDTELTDLGRAQAKETAQKLEREKIDHIYHTPLTRTKQTAQIIADHIGHQKITPHSDLIERDFGE